MPQKNKIPVENRSERTAVQPRSGHVQSGTSSTAGRTTVRAAGLQARSKLALSVQYPDPRLKESIPRTELRRWVQATLFAPAEFAIRFVDAEEGRTLNREYRGKDYATNVLTFAYTEDEDSEVTQADIILCTDVLQREAAEQNKSIAAHTAHLVVHGVLHAQGYDHETDEEAAEMEAIEIDILAMLGYANPYEKQ